MLRWVVNVFFGYFYALYYHAKGRARIYAGITSYSDFVAQERYPDYLKSGAALSAVKPLALKYCRGAGVDVGAGQWPLPGARAVEDSEHENAYILKQENESLDFVFSSHTLEHLEHPRKALTEWARVIKKGGTLFLYLPHPSCEMWHTEHLKYHKWNPVPTQIEEWLVKDYGFVVHLITYLPDAFFSFVVVARKGGDVE